MLTVDPMKRLSVPGVRKHEWFQQDLPAYLQISSTDLIRRDQTVSEEALNAVEKNLGYNRDKVRAALEMGTDLLSSRKFQGSDYAEMRKMAVAYHLTLTKITRANLKSPELGPMCPQSPWLSTMTMSGLPAPQTPMRTPESIPGTPMTGSIPPRSPEKERSVLTFQSGMRPHHWTIGFWAEVDQAGPAQMMIQLFKILRVLHFKWKVVTPYNVICKPIDTGIPNGIKVNFSLYATGKKDEYQSRQQSRYILDIHRVAGDPITFLDFSCHVVDLLVYPDQR